MTISQHLVRFGGLTVTHWWPGEPLPDPATSMPRLSYDGKLNGEELIRAYLEQPGVEATRGIVVGCWAEEMYEVTPDAVIDALVAGRERLPDLRVLFLGDITFEENEISWICNTDQSRLYQAFPNLEHVAIRGGNDLRLPGLSLPRLQTLVIETGGMSRDLLRDVLAAQLPALTHLELYTGAQEYGADTDVGDVAPLLTGLFPGLTCLGLRNSEYTDAICAALAGAPVLNGLELLDLSLGTLTDTGARALADNPAIRGLRKLDVHHHYLTDVGEQLLRGLGIEVDLSDRQQPEDWGEGPVRFVAIGE